LYFPVVSLITAILEILLAGIAFKIKGRKKIRYTSAILLLLLASYQILEIFICRFSYNKLFLSRLAFIIIIWLPPTGILLISFLWPFGNRFVSGYFFLFSFLALLMVIWIIFSRKFITETICFTIFARYFNDKIIYLVYSILYEFGLLSMLFLSAFGTMYAKEQKQRKLLGQILVGTMSFVLFSLLTVISISETKGALPSVMCHYALLLAIFVGRLLYLESKIN